MMSGASKDVWEKFVRGLPPGSVPQLIFSSWQRSKHAGVHAEAPSFHRMSSQDLEALLLEFADLIAWVSPELGRLSSILPQPNAAYLASPDGTVLRSVSTSPEILDLYGLAPGFNWSEKLMGTNGAGTALATGEPVAIIGCDHYCAAWHDAACMAAPLHDAGGRIAGAIDVTIPRGAARPEHLAEVVRSALTIERALKGAGAAQEARPEPSPRSWSCARKGSQVETSSPRRAKPAP